jgi:hypothetical protein
MVRGVTRWLPAFTAATLPLLPFLMASRMDIEERTRLANARRRTETDEAFTARSDGDSAVSQNSANGISHVARMFNRVIRYARFRQPGCLKDLLLRIEESCFKRMFVHRTALLRAGGDQEPC